MSDFICIEPMMIWWYGFPVRWSARFMVSHLQSMTKAALALCLGGGVSNAIHPNWAHHQLRIHHYRVGSWSSLPGPTWGFCPMWGNAFQARALGVPIVKDLQAEDFCCFDDVVTLGNHGHSCCVVHGNEGPKAKAKGAPHGPAIGLYPEWWKSASASGGCPFGTSNPGVFFSRGHFLWSKKKYFIVRF